MLVVKYKNHKFHVKFSNVNEMRINQKKWNCYIVNWLTVEYDTFCQHVYADKQYIVPTVTHYRNEFILNRLWDVGMYSDLDE